MSDCLDSAITDYVPDKLIHDKPSDSDKLRDRLDEPNVELICPHRMIDQLALGRPAPRHTMRILFVSLSQFCQDCKSSDPIQAVLKLPLV